MLTRRNPSSRGKADAPGTLGADPAHARRAQADRGGRGVMQAALDLARGEVRCPACAGGLLTLASPAETAAGCAACGASYPVEDGVIDLLPGDPARRTVAQMIMEAEPVVRIYESRLWRRGPHVSLVLGISFEREQELILRVADLTG